MRSLEKSLREIVQWGEFLFSKSINILVSLFNSTNRNEVTMWYLMLFPVSICYWCFTRLKNAFRQNTGHYECSAEVNEVEANALRPKRASGLNLNMGIFIDVLCKYIFLIKICFVIFQDVYFTDDWLLLFIFCIFHIWEYSCCHNSILKCILLFNFHCCFMLFIFVIYCSHL